MVVKELKTLPKGMSLLRKKIKQYDEFLENIRKEERRLQERKLELLAYLNKEMKILFENKEVFLTAINAHKGATKYHAGWANYRLHGLEKHPARSEKVAIRAYPYAEQVLERIETIFKKLYNDFAEEDYVLNRELKKIELKEKIDKMEEDEIKKLKNSSYTVMRSLIEDIEKDLILEEKEMKIVRTCYQTTERILNMLRKKYEKQTTWKSGFIFHKEFSVTIFDPEFFNTWNNRIKPEIKYQMSLIEELMKIELLNEKLDIQNSERMWVDR